MHLLRHKLVSYCTKPFSDINFPSTTQNCLLQHIFTFRDPNLSPKEQICLQRRKFISYGTNSSPKKQIRLLSDKFISHDKYSPSTIQIRLPRHICTSYDSYILTTSITTNNHPYSGTYLQATSIVADIKILSLQWHIYANRLHKARNP